MTTTDPTARTYGETWAGRGVPMDELAAFVARAVDAGAPLTARIRLEDADRNVLLGLTVPGTRMSVTWPYRPRPAAPSLRAGAYDETERVIALEDARYRQERAKGGPVDTSRLALIGEREGEQLDYRTHADPPPPDDVVELGMADPWPFKPGDVLGGADGPWLDAAPKGTIVDHAGREWTNDGTKPGDDLPTWVHGRDGTSLELHLDRIASDQLARLGPLTVVRVGEDQSPPTEPWPFKPGDVVDDVEGAITEWLDAAPVETVVTDHFGDEWKHEGLSSWVGTHRIASPDVAARGPLTVVSVGRMRA